jgi:hypothetical protein
MKDRQFGRLIPGSKKNNRLRDKFSSLFVIERRAADLGTLPNPSQ